MGIGKTLSGILLIGAVGTGGYLLGKNYGQDKEYGIKRDKTEVYLDAKQSGKTYLIKVFDGQPYLKNNSEFQLNVFKTELTGEITDIVTEKFSDKSKTSLDNKVSKE